MPKDNNVGFLGEEAAAKYLKKLNYTILDRNYQNNSGRRLGEIDIVAFDVNQKELVFVEVKTREGEKFKDTLPEENITYAKLRKLSKIAEAYLRVKNKSQAAYRFDAVSVWLDREKNSAKIKHIISL